MGMPRHAVMNTVGSAVFRTPPRVLVLLMHDTAGSGISRVELDESCNKA